MQTYRVELLLPVLGQGSNTFGEILISLEDHACSLNMMLGYLSYVQYRP